MDRDRIGISKTELFAMLEVEFKLIGSYTEVIVGVLLTISNEFFL